MPPLQQLHENLVELNGAEIICKNKRLEVGNAFANYDPEREDECGICLEGGTKMVLPNCCHAMCINCYRDWNTISESCPFCPSSIKRVDLRDLSQFHLYIQNLPNDCSDTLFLMYYEYLI